MKPSVIATQKAALQAKFQAQMLAFAVKEKAEAGAKKEAQKKAIEKNSGKVAAIVFKHSAAGFVDAKAMIAELKAVLSPIVKEAVVKVKAAEFVGPVGEVLEAGI